MSLLKCSQPRSLLQIGNHFPGELQVIGDSAAVINAIATRDSECQPGTLFVAQRGSKVDSHDLIPAAIINGASAALVCDADRLGTLPGLVARSGSHIVGRVAAFLAGNPTEHLKVVGITGTNGKTTTHWLVHHMLVALGLGGVRIGTLGVVADSSTGLRVFESDTGLTTPDSVALQGVLVAAREHHLATAVMEVSSHALDQGRVSGVRFDVGVFTNLTRDHLDYHGSMERYAQAKSQLFDLLVQSPGDIRAAVIHRGSEYGEQIYRHAIALGLRDFSFAWGTEGKGSAETLITKFEQRVGAGLLELQDASSGAISIHSAFIGAHNAENLAAAYSVGRALGFEPREIANALAIAPQVPGRLESVGTPDLGIYVDYAHTPDALERVLATLRPLVRETNRLWVIFGCGGDRDRGKRPQMAKVAREGADMVVVTSDNPRTEDPGKIIEDILSTGVRADLIEADRSTAIASTLAQTQPGDIVLIAGKGHEQYQIIGTESRYFSDQEEVRRWIRQTG